MRRFLQLVLEIFLCLAIPVQAVHAAAMVLEMAAGSGREDAATCPQHTSADSMPGMPTRPAEHTPCAHHCDGGACCAAVAMVSLPLAPQPGSRTQHFAAPPCAETPVFLTPGLERPPKDSAV